VLDQDYVACLDEEIKEIRVAMTIVGGRVAWRREQHAHS